MSDDLKLEAIDRAFTLVDRPLWIVTSGAGGHRAGLTAANVWRASIDPLRPMLLVLLASDHATCQTALRTGALSAHLLSRNQAELAYRFAASSSAELDKFAGLNTVLPDSSALSLAECLARFDGAVRQTTVVGSQTLFWVEIATANSATGAPLLLSDFWVALSGDQKHRLKSLLDHDIALQREGWNA